MIGTGEAGYVAAIRRQALDVPNLAFAGFVPHADIESHFDGASLHAPADARTALRSRAEKSLIGSLPYHCSRPGTSPSATREMP